MKLDGPGFRLAAAAPLFLVCIVGIVMSIPSILQDVPLRNPALLFSGLALLFLLAIGAALGRPLAMLLGGVLVGLLAVADPVSPRYTGVAGAAWGLALAALAIVTWRERRRGPLPARRQLVPVAAVLGLVFLVAYAVPARRSIYPLVPHDPVAPGTPLGTFRCHRLPGGEEVRWPGPGLVAVRVTEDWLHLKRELDDFAEVARRWHDQEVRFCVLWAGPGHSTLHRLAADPAYRELEFLVLDDPWQFFDATKTSTIPQGGILRDGKVVTWKPSFVIPYFPYVLHLDLEEATGLRGVVPAPEERPHCGPWRPGADEDADAAETPEHETPAEQRDPREEESR